MNKNKVLSFAICFLLIEAINTSSVAEAAPVKTVKEISESKESLTKPDADILFSRLKEIQHMDFTAMSRVEKKEIRKEVQGISKKVHQQHSGEYIYISLTAILIIILLIVLL